MRKERIVSGITATGKLTIGNYFGAIKSYIELQEKMDLFIFVADLHAITIDIKKEELKENKKNIFALLLASGINPEKSTLFFQSDNDDHTKLNWITTCYSNMGELSRMTQFKDKSINFSNKNKSTFIPTGLFIYPNLMAADIMLYNPDLVPVGIDQKQHMEFYQKLVKRINSRLKLNLNIAKGYYAKIGSKIMSLKNPNKKMSKSDEDINSSIYLLDDPIVAFNKVLKATTDSENKVYYDLEKKPGVSNLLTIYSILKEISINESEEKFKDQNYLIFKQEVATEVREFLIKLQKKYYSVLPRVDELREIGAKKAKEISNEQIKLIYEKIGFN